MRPKETTHTSTDRWYFKWQTAYYILKYISSNSRYNTVYGANRKFNNIVSGIEDGKRYNPATSEELSTTISELQSSRRNVDAYVNKLYSYDKNENNPFGYVDVDLNGASIALDPVTDEPITVKRYFLEAWYNEIHAAYNTLNAGAEEVAADVKNRAFVLGDVNNNGVIDVADVTVDVTRAEATAINEVNTEAATAEIFNVAGVQQKTLKNGQVNILRDVNGKITKVFKK